MSILSPIVNGLPGSITTAVNSQLSSLPQTFNFSGNSATFAVVSAATGCFTSLLASTGGFTSVQSGSYYNATGQSLVLTPGAFVGSLASTGASTALLYNPITYRGPIVPTASGSSGYISSLTLTSPAWTKAAYSVCLSSVPSGATVKAQCLLNGTVLPDSVSMDSNLVQTGTAGLNTVALTAPPAATVLTGFSHFVSTAGSALTLSLACTPTGTCVAVGGALEVFQMQ